MITRSRRGPRIDYNILNNSDAIVMHGTQQRTMSSGEDDSKLNASTNTTMIMTDVLGGMEELNDMMDEHQIHASSEEANNEVVNKMTTLRLSLRKQMIQLKAIDPNLHAVHENSFAQVLLQVKDFMKSCKEQNSQSLLQNAQAEEKRM